MTDVGSETPEATVDATHDAMQEKRYRSYVIVCILLAVVGMVLYAPRAVEESYHTDFCNYYTGGCLAATSGDIYQWHEGRAFFYPPIFAQITMPIAIVSEYLATGEYPTADAPSDEGARIGATIWYAVLCLCYLGSLFFAVWLARPESWGQAFWIGLIAATLTVRMFVMNVRLGQVNMLVMAVGIAGCFLLTRARPFGGGVMLALAAALKYVPGGFLFWFVRRKNTPAVLGLAIGAILYFAIMPIFRWGPQGTKDLYQTYFAFGKTRILGLDHSDRNDHKDPAGQSLLSMSDRLLRHVSAVTPRRGEPLYINLVDAPNVAKVVKGLFFVLATVFFLWPCGGRLENPPWRAALEIGMVFLLLLAISPESRRAHYIVMLVPVAAWARHALSTPERRRLLWWLVPVFVLTSLSSRGIWGDSLFYYSIQAYGVMLWGGLLLAGIIWQTLRRMNQDRGTSQSEIESISEKTGTPS